ncbi:hypothetical protein GF339_19975 [candidate division KSB3 bacterium]|uniref:Uncharacterized protein n=1 Tax=candidate division KSB3 bacterium TaxID=2044937 RepID=A0A9D5JZ36_9BACT|nr:hypothetical protein [candidate division KSB3 bacterium]
MEEHTPAAPGGRARHSAAIGITETRTDRHQSQGTKSIGMFLCTIRLHTHKPYFH